MSFGTPGTQEARFTTDAELLWGGDETKIQVLRKGYVVGSASVDAGNTPTTVLRKGLLLGLHAATDKLRPYDPDASDGTENLIGVLSVELDMLDELNVAVDKYAPVIVSAPVKASQLLLRGVALIGDADEAAARTALNAKRFYLDDEF